jgi:acetyl esterase/lipase
MKIETIELYQYQKVSIQATIYGSHPNLSTLLYLHGGGLIFGERNDLPMAYIKKIVNAGQTVITLDYLLAPESKLDAILTALNQSINQLNQCFSIFNNLTVMGRSAGAYLAYLLIRDGLPATNLIDLYGYSRLDYPEFRMPAPFYNQFPKVLPMTAQAQVGKSPLTTGKMSGRYPIYVSARQFGTWMNMILPSQQVISTYSLNDDDLKQMPRTLMLHSLKDPDVPFIAAKQAAMIMPMATLIPISQSVHDFDHNVTTENLAYYDQIVNFISTTC